MGRRIVNRMERRAEFEAAERRQQDEERDDEEEEGEEDEDEEEEGEEAEEGEEGEGDDEEAPKPKKKAPPPKVKAKAKPRTRTAKVVRMRVIWGVFNNSHQMVASYEYPKKQDAEAHAAKLTTDKRSTHFVQPVKEAIEEKKEK